MSWASLRETRSFQFNQGERHTSETLCRFQTTFLGSRAIAGDLLDSGMLSAEDKNGVTVRESLGVTSNEDHLLSRLAYKGEQVKG